MQSILQQTRENSESPFLTPWRLAVLGILLLSVAVYYRALTGSAITDDYLLLNGYVSNIHSFLQCFTRPFLYHYFRPLVSVSFYLDRLLSGGSPFFSHQVNILIHLLTTACLMGLLLSAFQSRRIAILGGLFFAVQPVQVSAVAWIGGRTDSLSAFFVILFAWALVAGARTQGKPRTLYLAASAAAYAAALLTKEQNLALLPLAPLAFACFGQKQEGLRSRAAWLAAAPFALLALLYIVIWRTYFPSLQLERPHGWEQAALAGRTSLYYTLVLLATTPRWIHSTSLGGLLRAGAWTVWLGYGLMGTYLLLLRHWLRTAPKAAWFLALALLGLLPVSNLVPVPTMTIAPYRAAVAGLGVAALLGYALNGVFALSLARRQHRLLALAGGLLGLAYLIACAGLSARSAAQWSDQMHLCQTLVRYDPDSLYASNNLIGAYLDTNQPKRAGQQAEAMLTRLFGSPIWRQPQAAWRLFQKDPSIADYIRQSIGDKSPAKAWVGILYARLGTAWQERGDLTSSQACLAASLLFDPGTMDINLAVGKYDCAVGKYAEAIPYLRYAQSSSYAFIPDPYLLLGEAYTALGQWEPAKTQYQDLIGLEPWLGPAYLGLANAQRHLGDAAGAQKTLQTAQRRAVLTPEQALRMLDTNLRSTR